jgi:hypothetical protein
MLIKLNGMLMAKNDGKPTRASKRYDSRGKGGKKKDTL